MDAPEEPRQQQPYAPSPPTIPTFNLATFVVDDIAPYDPNIFVDFIKHQIETQIFGATQTAAPQEIVVALTDKVVSGHFKYHDPDTRQLRDEFNHVKYVDLQDIQPLLPLTDDAQPDQRFERALVQAITTYFRIANLDHGLTVADFNDVANRHVKYLPLEYASAYIIELVHIVYHSASGDRAARAAAVTKLVAGVPSTFTDTTWAQRYLNLIGRHHCDSEVELLYWTYLFSMVSNKVSFEEQPIYSAPLSRWKVSMGTKVASFILAGPERNIFDVASRFVDLDFAHNRIESGLALSHPILGSAIVSPMSASTMILYEMAGCVQERKDLQFERVISGHGSFRTLFDTDKGVNCNILGIDVKEESMVSMGYYFPKGALADYFDTGLLEPARVLISKDGIVLYPPKHRGPWADLANANGKGGRDPMKFVLKVAYDERSSEQTQKAIVEKRRRMEKDWLMECPVSEETKKRFGYIINKPGRPLVRRRGIRGNYGRFIAAGLLICGATVTGLNFAGRDNWLEQIFDGAQVASLLAAVTIAVIFLLSGTLVDTLDLLAGKTEAQDVEHLCTLTGLTIEELQGVLTYARGTLYWLSEHRASYCRATKLGPIVMTPPLNVNQNPETKLSVVMDDHGADLAVWVMQGRLSKVERSSSGDGTLHVEDVPFEPRLVRRSGGGDIDVE